MDTLTPEIELTQETVDAKFDEIVERIETEVSPEELEEVVTPQLKPAGAQDQGYRHD